MISSRTLLLTLVVLNLLAFAWWTGALGVFFDTQRQPQRLEKQIEPDRLRLLSPDETASDTRRGAPDLARAAIAGSNASGSQTASVGSASTAATTTTTTTDPAPGAAEPASATAGSGPATNAAGTPVAATSTTGAETVPSASPAGLPGLEMAAQQIARTTPPVAALDAIGDAPARQQTALAPADGTASARNGTVGSPAVSATDLAARSPSLPSEQHCEALPEMDFVSARRWRERLDAGAIATRLRRLDEGAYQLFVQPLASREAADARGQTIRAFGVSEARVIEQGVFRNGVSLATVAGAEEAGRLREQFEALGIDSIVIGPDTVADGRYQLEIRAPAAVIADRVRPVVQRAQLGLQACAP